MSFKNIPTQKFYQYFKDKIANKEITAHDLAAKFGKYESNPTSFLQKLESGKNGITVDNILLAKEHFQLDPILLFQDKKANYNHQQHIDTKTSEDEHKLYDNDTTAMQIIASQQKLIAQLIKEKSEATEYATSKKVEGLQIRLLSLQQLVLDLAEGKRFQSRLEALQAIDKADFPEDESRKMSSSTGAGSSNN